MITLLPLGVANGRLTAITDPAGKDYTFTYSCNFLAAVTWPDGSGWRYAHDSNGLMLSKTDPLGNLTGYTYDDSHRVTQGSDSSGAVSVAHSDAASNVKNSVFTREDGGIWNYTYDAHDGVLTKKTDPLGRATTYGYDAYRNLIRETAPDGSITRYTYDGAGNRLSTTDALGNTTSYTYNSLGQVTGSTDPLGRTTTNTYDEKGRLIQAADPLGAKTIYLYDAKGNLTRVTNALNQASSFAYDAAGNRTSGTDPGGATTSFTYDAMGNLLTQTDSLGKVVTYEYDNRYRLAKVTDPLGNSTTYAYDLKGNKTSQTDANGNVTRYEYDLQGHVAKSIDALDNATTYTYGATGCTGCGGGTDKLTSLTDAKGQTTSYQYDRLGRLIQETDPLQRTTQYSYDPAGNMDLKTDANGIHLGYGYDSLKRLTGKTYPDGSSVSYTYDGAGRILSAANHDVAYSYAYDAAGRMTNVADSRGYRLAYEYDLLGNRTRTTFQPGTPDQRVTSYAYDDGGRLSAIRSPAGTFSYGYDAAGRRTSLGYPNQITASYAYDAAGRLVRLAHAAAGGSTIAAFGYALDKAGNRTNKTATEAEQYLYDAVYRLLTVTSPRPETFGYDAVGNRQRGPGAKDTGYLYNAGNQVVQGRKLGYGYDKNGNQTGRFVPGASDKGWTQTWDYENRLVWVEQVKGAERKTVSFSYDPLGRRIGKKMTTVIDGVTRNQAHDYVYDEDNIVWEVQTDDSGGGTARTFFTHGSGVDEHLAMERNGQLSYYHADGLGSVVALTDQSRRVVQSYEYDSFGMVKPSSSSFVNSYTYTGREWDKETGLYYYRARYYDPMEGRFISKDPIGFEGGINIYLYVDDNPINYFDPSGLVKIPAYIPNSSVISLFRTRAKEFGFDLSKCSDKDLLDFIDSVPANETQMFSDSYDKRPDAGTVKTKKQKDVNQRETAYERALIEKWIKNWKKSCKGSCVK